MKLATQQKNDTRIGPFFGNSVCNELGFDNQNEWFDPEVFWEVHKKFLAFSLFFAFGLAAVAEDGSAEADLTCAPILYPESGPNFQNEFKGVTVDSWEKEVSRRFGQDGLFICRNGYKAYLDRKQRFYDQARDETRRVLGGTGRPQGADGIDIYMSGMWIPTQVVSVWKNPKADGWSIAVAERVSEACDRFLTRQLTSTEARMIEIELDAQLNPNNANVPNLRLQAAPEIMDAPRRYFAIDWRGQILAAQRMSSTALPVTETLVQALTQQSDTSDCGLDDRSNLLNDAPGGESKE
jgi:hypothetical protein